MIKNFYISDSVSENIKNYIQLNYRNSVSIQEKWLIRYYFIYNKVNNTQKLYKGNRGVALNIKSLVKGLQLKNSQELSKIIKFFLDNNIFQLTKEYLVGSHSRQYKVKKYYSEQKHNKIKMTNPLIESIENMGYKLPNNQFFSTYKTNLNAITIPVVCLPELPKSTYNSVSDTLVQPHADSRVYHVICNLKREFRQHLLWNNERLLQSDVRCSQVFLGLIQYLKYSAFPIENQPEDIQRLYKECIDGTFYDTLMSATGHKDRNRFKELFFKSVYFNDFTSMNNKIAKTFEKLFPTMFAYVYITKKINGYQQFAINLQSFEWNIIRNVLDRLYSMNINAINLHDAILFPQNVNFLTVEKVINEVYTEMVQITPSIKTELF